MKCVVCKLGETKRGTTTLTLVRSLQKTGAEVTLVLKRVPAQVCANCGEAYVDEKTSVEAMRIAEQAVRGKAQVEIRDFGPIAGA